MHARINRKSIILALFIVLLVLLSLSNIKNYLSENKVLGAETINSGEKEFWDKYLTEYPNYIPGLVETNNLIRANQIDPNFKLDLQ